MKKELGKLVRAIIKDFPLTLQKSALNVFYGDNDLALKIVRRGALYGDELGCSYDGKHGVFLRDRIKGSKKPKCRP